MRQYALSHKDLTEKLKELETKYNKQFKDVYDAINYLYVSDFNIRIIETKIPSGYTILIFVFSFANCILQKDTIEIQQENRKRIGYK